MSKNFSNLPNWLPPLIYSRGMSIEQLARAIGVNRNSVYKYVEDKSRPETQTMARICEVLGVPLEEGLAQYTEKRRGRPPKHYKSD